MNPLLIAIVGVAVFFGVGWWRQHRHLRRIHAQRRGATYEDYVAGLDGATDDPKLARAVYDALQTQLAYQGFPVLAGDSLHEVYALGTWGGVPLDEFIEDSLDELLPDDFDSNNIPPELAEVPLETVRDLVCVLEMITTQDKATSV